jgi:hypothetical protein
MDLFGPIAYVSIGGNKYDLVIVDDFSRYTWYTYCKIKVKLKGLSKNLLEEHKISLN